MSWRVTARHKIRPWEKYVNEVLQESQHWNTQRAKKWEKYCRVNGWSLAQQVNSSSPFNLIRWLFKTIHFFSSRARKLIFLVWFCKLTCLLLAIKGAIKTPVILQCSCVLWKLYFMFVCVFVFAFVHDWAKCTKALLGRKEIFQAVRGGGGGCGDLSVCWTALLFSSVFTQLWGKCWARWHKAIQRQRKEVKYWPV